MTQGSKLPIVQVGLSKAESKLALVLLAVERSIETNKPMPVSALMGIEDCVKEAQEAVTSTYNAIDEHTCVAN